MKIRLNAVLMIFLLGLAQGAGLCRENNSSPWTLDSCLAYAREMNIDVRKASLDKERNTIYLDQSRAARLPSLSASLNQNFSWNYTYTSSSGTEATGQATGSTSSSLNSSMDLFKGLQINNQIKQSELNLISSEYALEAIEESLELNILNAFLNVLYAGEGVSNAEKQIEATGDQLSLAQERLSLGIISESDFLQIRSELASEKQTLVDAKNELLIARINLMQLMEYPVNDNFELASPDLDKLLVEIENPDVGQIFQDALEFKPQIKLATNNTEIALLDEAIARAALRPSLSLNASLGTNYTGLRTDLGYFDQLADNFSPRLGLSLNIPIFQKKQAKTSVGIARIGINEATLNEIETRNSLRKEIEQAAAGVVSARQEFLASQEGYAVTQESVEVATEKMTQGLMNSVDYLFERTNLILAESQLLQSKYKLIFSKKVLDFYRGVPITL